MAASLSTSISPPTGGWDTRNSLADMPEENAVILQNWFASTDSVETRRGNSSHVTGMPSSVETVIEYIPLTASGELYAASGGDIYDVASAGAVGAAVATGFTNDRWQQVQIGTAAGQFVRLFNGADTSVVYNGSSWGTTPAITGAATPASLIWGNVHQRRMWFGEVDSLIAYYLPVNSVGGSSTAFSLAGIAKLGGYIMAMGTWTRDAGDGMDDVAVFLTSEGEAIVYSGTDPASASTWVLVGRFRIGKPIGRRCIVQGGSDLILVTQDGFVPLSAILSIDRSQTKLVALSDQISKAVNDSVRAHGTLFGWQPILYPKGTMMIFNVPQANATYDQYVFNTITGAPCRFTGIDAISWGMLNDNLYWGDASGNVNKFDDGKDDLGSNIESDALQAFSTFKSPQHKKGFKNVQLLFQSQGNPNPAVDLNIDYQIAAPVGTPQAFPVSSALWGISKWGVGLWGSALQVYEGWRGVRGVGRAASIRIRINSNTGQKKWIDTRYTFVPGGQM